MPNLQRAQILLKPSQRSALREIAERERTSVSNVVRALAEEGLKSISERESEARKQKLCALERIRSRSEKLADEGVWIEDPTTEILQSRNERGEEINAWRSPSPRR